MKLYTSTIFFIVYNIHRPHAYFIRFYYIRKSFVNSLSPREQTNRFFVVLYNILRCSLKTVKVNKYVIIIIITRLYIK